MRQWLIMMTGGLYLTLASSVHALGVGDPRQVSALNRPLHVVLPLTDGGGLELSQVSVAVADDAAYRQSGLTRSALVDALSAQVVRQGDGLALVLDSPRRVREPFLDLLLIVTWPEGQWQRQVSLLFDPIDYASSQPLLGGDRSPSQRYALSETSKGVAASGTPMVATPVVDAYQKTVPTGPQPWPARLTSHPGDSLSTLAASLMPRSGISRQSLMVALFQSNPAAFIDGDLNRLRAGVALDVPAIDAVADMSRADAVSTLQVLARQTEDGRPLIDIVGRDAPATSDSSASAQLATLEQRLSDLVDETERQRATIAALQDERDTLQGALAAVEVRPATADTQDAGATSAVSGISGDRATQANGLAVTASTVAPTAAPTIAGVATSGIARKAMASPVSSPVPSSTASLWQRLIGHVDWIGGGLLVLLLGLWAWQRRRRHAKQETTALVVEMSSKATAESGPRASRQPSASVMPRRAATDVDVDSASISQADIYMAYGRHAEARDWLRQQLAQAEDAQLRLGLLRALGELRDMDAMEQTLAGFGDDASPEQRQEGQALVDDYRVRYVEESWQEATAEVVEDQSDVAWEGGVEATDALFEWQTAETAGEGHSLSAEDERLDEAGEPDTQRDPMSALFDDELPSSSEASEAGLPSSIEYEAPMLDLSAGQPDEAAWSPSQDVSSSSDAPSASADSPHEASSSTAMPAIDFSAISLEPLPEESPGILDAPAMPAADDRKASGTVSSLRTEDADLRTRNERGRGARLEVPAGWDVEEVEFQSLHRDNGRP